MVVSNHGGVAVFPDLSQEAAQRQLDPFNERFIAAIREAVRKFNSIEPTALYILSKRARSKANAIWAFIMHEVETTMGDLAEAGLDLKPSYESIELHVGNNLVARIKKMRPNGFTSNVMTARVSDFFSADQAEMFPGMWAQPMRVDVGYILDDTGLQVAEILVAHRLRPRAIHWTYSMLPPADVIPLPVQPPVPVTPAAAETRIVARESENANPKPAQGTDDV